MYEYNTNIVNNKEPDINVYFIKRFILNTKYIKS